MINKNIKILEKYCSDYKNIENYEEALHSPLKYDLHHRREISENKSRKDLKEENLYYDRPPEELIFIEAGEHRRLHKKGNQNTLGHHFSEETKQKMSAAQKGDKNPMFGKRLSVETRQKISDAMKGKQCAMGHHCSAETIQRMSAAQKGIFAGEKNPMFGKHWHLEDGHRIWTD